MRWLILGALVACGGNNAGGSKNAGHPPGYLDPTGEVWLTVNGREITSEMVMATSRLMPQEEIDRLKRSGGWVQKVEQVGLGEVLYLDALEKGLHKDPGVQAAMAMAIRETLAQENFKQRVEARVTDGTINKYYQDRKVQYKREQAHARHILVREEALANKILGELKGGADFAKMVTEHSIDTATKDQGGDLGWFNKNMLDDSIAKITFEAEINDLLGPIETRFGYHIFQVLERRDQVPLEEVRAEIVTKLRNEQAEKVLEEIRATTKMKRMGEVQEIFERTKDLGSDANPMGATPPPARPGAGTDLPGARVDSMGGGMPAGGGHGGGGHGGGH